MDKIVFDIETDGLSYTKIHCLSYCVIGEYEIKTIYSHSDIREFFKRDAIFIGHFISNFDLPAITNLLGIDFNNINFWDTLFLASYIFPLKDKIGLEDFGVDYGVPKVKIAKDEWLGSVDEDPQFKQLMTLRCETDVKINTNLFVNIMNRLNTLYGKNEELIDKLLKYLAFKAKCAYIQQINKVLVDKDAAIDLLSKLSVIKLDKEKALAEVMPSVPKFSIKEKPAIMYKKDGSISANGEKWFAFLKEHGISEDNEKPVRYVHSWAKPNPQSSVQIKNWLFSLGWEPCTFRFERDKATNEVKQIPQILNEDKELSDSVSLLLDKVPELELLEGLGVINHRISLLEGRKKNNMEERKGIIHALDKDNYVAQDLKNITSTHRFRHGALVNIPSPQKPFGKDLRSLFVAPKGKVIIGCDVKNLESRTRDHCIQPLDPDYVEEMSQPGYDNHLDIAVFAGLLTEEQAQAHKDGKEDYSGVRKVAKQLNFAAVYNVGAKTLSRNTGKSIEECYNLLDGYWKRNWAVKEFAESLTVKKALGSKWIKSELTGFWLELRSDNDKFSAHNQNLGVMFFDTWLSYVMLLGVTVVFQTHDEIFFYWDEGQEEKAFKILNKAAKLANKRLNLNVEIGVDAKAGSNYGDVH